MKVPLLDLRRQYAQIRPEVEAAIASVVESQQFILGEEVRKFEEKVAAYCGCRYGVGVSSGTDAVLLALMALDIGLGDEVVTHLTYHTGTCTIVLDAPARPPGMVPIWVSAYGGGDPWVLAGFFTYSGGVIDDCVQPGFHCAPTDTCCATVEVAMGCQTGRCHRQ